MRNMFLAAFAALVFIPTSAMADGTDESDRIPEPCSGCGTKKPAPKPAPAPAPAPAPEPEPEVTVPPAPAPVTNITNNYTNVVFDGEGIYGFVRVGGSIGGAGGLWAMPAQVIDGSAHPALPAAELQLGAYVGIGGWGKHQPYFDLHAAYSRGSAMSVGYSAGATVGYAVSNHVILGLEGHGAMRDYLVFGQEYGAQFVGGGGGLTAIVDLGDPTDALDVSIVPALGFGVGTAKSATTGEVMPATDLSVGASIRLGLRGPWKKK